MGEAASVDCLVAFDPKRGELRDVAVRDADSRVTSAQRHDRWGCAYAAAGDQRCRCRLLEVGSVAERVAPPRHIRIGRRKLVETLSVERRLAAQHLRREAVLAEVGWIGCQV